MYRYDNYTDSFVRIDGEPNTGSTTVKVGVPLKEMAIVKKVELTDECIDKIADAVVRKLADRKTENSSEKPNNSTISKMEQVDKDINVRSKDCETCKHYKLACELFSEICKYEPTTQTETQNSNLTFEKADEPQTDCDGCKHYADEYTADACYECKRSYKDCYEPQTERSE